MTAVLTVGCPVCGAFAGYACQDGEGRGLNWFHVGRFDLADSEN